MRLCWFNPTFIASQEHSDDDLQALFDQLADVSDVAGRLKSSQFRINTSKPAAAGANKKAPTDYAALYPPELRERVDQKYKVDFGAFAYAQDTACAH